MHSSADHEDHILLGSVAAANKLSAGHQGKLGDHWGKNIQENPYAVTTVVNPNDMSMYTLDLKFDHSETEGDLFDEMDMKLEAIASMQGMSGIYKLLAADVYKVLNIS